MKPGPKKSITVKGQSRAVPGLGARLVAFDCLDAVLNHNSSLDDALAGQTSASWQTLPERDQAFARLLIMTVLRRLGQIDAILESFLTRKPKGKGRSAITALRLGAAQLLFLETPAHAAVSATTAIADKRRLQGFKGLINAVLRKTANALEAVEKQDAAILNTPKWFWTRLVKDYGEEKARHIAEAHLDTPPIDVTPGPHADATLKEALGATQTPTGSWRISDLKNPSKAPGFEQGAWWVQDAAAALPAAILLSSFEDPSKLNLVDLCAAPGGKTLQLAASGAKVTAVDISSSRLSRLKENLSRTGLQAEIIEADATIWKPNALVDGVLLDAPCTASGTVRRHPELPWIKSDLDPKALAEMQRELLAHASRFLKPGGVLVYATCSLFKEEGEAIVQTAKGLEPYPILDGTVPSLKTGIISEGYLRTFPFSCHGSSGAEETAFKGGMDGFFIARFRKPH